MISSYVLLLRSVSLSALTQAPRCSLEFHVTIIAVNLAVVTLVTKETSHLAIGFVAHKRSDRLGTDDRRREGNIKSCKVEVMKVK